MTPWATLLADALVGTDRREGVDPAGLLDRSAALAAFRRAGTRPVSVTAPRPAPAPNETRPVVGEAAAQRLVTLLEDGAGFDAAIRDALLHEWLELVRDHGRRVPPELLPTLLDYGRSHGAVRPLLAVAGGARVHWLAQQNPEWTYVTRQIEETADPSVWETGSRAQRRGYLAALRRRDPAAARALLTDEWAALAASERADLLPTLAIGLGADDEPLLESALDDRRKEVRAVAADLLAVLPGSAYQQRAIARARRHLVVDGPRVEVRPPEACDREMRRDGIGPKPPAGIGERAWWLEEVLARAPLSAWPMSPESLLAAVDGSDWAATVHRGLARAAATQRDPAWAVALLDRLGDGAREREIAKDLYPLLPPDEVVARATRALASGTVAGLGPLLDNCPRPWPPELARLVLAGFSDLAQHTQMRGALYHLARLAALRLPPTAAASAGQLAESLSWVEGVDPVPLEMLVRVLSFRHAMAQEIT